MELVDLFGSMETLGRVTEDQAIVAMKVNEIVKFGDVKRLHKFGVFLEKIL